jgi:tetratricopeptide (TPR) repeat protein
MTRLRKFQSLWQSGFGRRILPIFLPVVVTAFVFAPVCKFGFLNYDDNLNVYANPLIYQFDWPAFLGFWQRSFQGMYIPLTYTVWGLAARLSYYAGGPEAGLNPGLFHTVNLVLHLGSVVVVFDLLRRLLRNDLGAAAGALLFGLHPAQVEAVAWVTGLKDLLSGFCSLLALRQYLLYLANRDEAGKGRVLDYGLAAGFFLAALLAKPSAVVVPFLLAALGYLLFREPWLKLARELGPWLALALGVALVTGMSQDAGLIGFRPSLWQRLLVVGDAYFFYLRKLVFPLANAIDYGRTPQAVLAGKWVYLLGTVPYLLVALFFRKVREPVPRVAVTLFLLALLPVSGLVSFYFQRISTVADRYLYLAMFGPALGLGWLVAVRESRLFKLAVLSGLILCGAQSIIQVMTWGNFENFYRHNLKVNPGSWFARNNFGTAYEGLGELEKAEEQYRLAIQINPIYSLPYYNLGSIMMKQGRYHEATDYFRKAVAVAGRYYLAYYQLGNALAALGNMEEALVAYQRVIEINPAFPGVYTQLGRLYLLSHRNGEAVAAFRQAIALDSEAKEPRFLLERLLIEDGQNDSSLVLERK